MSHLPPTTKHDADAWRLAGWLAGCGWLTGLPACRLPALGCTHLNHIHAAWLEGCPQMLQCQVLVLREVIPIVYNHIKPPCTFR